MENLKNKTKKIIEDNDAREMTKMLETGLDPNMNNGWMLRLAAKHGSSCVANVLLQFGANPNTCDKIGASPLQLAVYSGQHWESDSWDTLLSRCDASHLPDAAAVAVVFGNTAALGKILATGRCDADLPTTLTGRTIKSLLRSYNLDHVLKETSTASSKCFSSPQNIPPIAQGSVGSGPSLSPSVAQFFSQSARQPGLTPHRASPATPATPAASPTSIFTSPFLTLTQNEGN